MDYYICQKCGKKLTSDCFGEVYDNETGTYIEFCPFCGNHTDFKNAKACACCGDVFESSDMIEELCSDCFRDCANEQNLRSRFFESLSGDVQKQIISEDRSDFAKFVVERGLV